MSFSANRFYRRIRYQTVGNQEEPYRESPTGINYKIGIYLYFVSLIADKLTVHNIADFNAIDRLMMDKKTIQFELYCLLLKLANKECELIGIRLINERDLYFIGVSWLVKGELCFRSFNKLTMVYLTEFYLPKIILIRPQWRDRVNHWVMQPSSILSLGKLNIA